MSESGAQYKLCMEVLRRLHRAGALEHIVLVGSWCTHFYRRGGVLPGNVTLRTDDIDFLVPRPLRTSVHVDIPELLKGMDFIVKRGSSGSMQLEHADMKLEFLIPERGRGSDAPHYIPALGVMAQALRFLDFLLQDTAILELEEFRIQLPAPARFGLHKLIVSERRPKPAKAANDREQAVDVLRALMAQGKGKAIKETFDSLPPKWKAGISKALGKIDSEDIRKLLAGENSSTRQAK
jgi:hypothetical protein